MKTIVLLAMLSLIELYACAQGVKFENNISWDSLRAEAKKENKFIFLDFYTTWCAPCRQMDLEVYTSDKISAIFNTKFISAKIQMDSTKSDNEETKKWYKTATELGHKYNVNAYPSMVFLSPEGSFLHKIIGFRNTEDLIREINFVLDPKNQFSSFIRQYEDGNRDFTFIRQVVKLASESGQGVKSREIAQDYINSLKEEEMFTPDNFWFIYEFTKSTEDRGFNFLYKNSKKIAEIDPRLSKSYITNLLVKLVVADKVKPFSTSKDGRPDWDRIRKNLEMYGDFGDTVLVRKRKFLVFDYEIKPSLEKNLTWLEIKKIIESKKLGAEQEYLFGATAGYYAMKLFQGDKSIDEKFAKAGSYYLEKYPSFISIEMLNSNWCWNVFANSSSKALIEAALSWGKLLVSRCNTPTCFDTYANLLHKSGRTEEALKWEAMAVKAAPLDEEIRTAYEKMLKGLPTWTVAK